MILDHTDALRIALGIRWALTARPDGTTIALGPDRLRLEARPGAWTLRRVGGAALGQGEGLPACKAMVAAVLG